jgi:hypothetical protein
MDAFELLTTLRTLRVDLSLRGETLHLSAPKGTLSAELVEAVRGQKPDLLALLRAEEALAHPSRPPQAASTTAAPSVTDPRPVLSDTLDALSAVIPQGKRIGIDTETLGPDDHLPVPGRSQSKLLYVGIAVDGKRTAYPAEDRGAIQPWLASPNPKVLWNSSYDLPALRAAGYDVRGPILDPTWLIAFEDGLADRSLKTRGPYQYTQYLPKDYALYPDKVRAYCGNDALNALDAYNPDSPGCRLPLFALYGRMAPRFAEISLRGVPFYKDRLEVMLLATKVKLAELGQTLQGFRTMHWGSRDQVEAFLGSRLPDRRTPTGKRSTSTDALRFCRHPAAAILIQYRETGKLLDTYLLPYQGRNRVYGWLKLNGAYTGRTSCSDLNLQQVPKSLRTLFGLPGFDWVRMDYAGAELLVVAVESGCEPLLRAFRAGRNVHTETAALMFRVPPNQVTPAQRAIGKTCNFGIGYGGSWRVIQDNAAAAGRILSREEAEDFRARWFRAFPEIAAWQLETERRVRAGATIESAFGRKWRFPRHARNAALAAQISSTASDLLLFALDAVWTELCEIGLPVVLVHDEVDLLVPAGSFDETQWQRIAERMAGVHPRFPMRVEVSVGADWGSTEERFTASAMTKPQ